MITKAERRALRLFLKGAEDYPSPPVYHRYVLYRLRVDAKPRRWRVFPRDLDRTLRYHFARMAKADQAGQRGPATVYRWSKYLHTVINLRGAQARP